MSFMVNSKVVCIDAAWQPWVAQVYKQLPVKDQVYTVRKVCMRREDPRDKASNTPTVALLLHELVNPNDPSFKGELELAFREERFRPLEELMETDHLHATQTDYVGQPLVPAGGQELVHA